MEVWGRKRPQSVAEPEIRGCAFSSWSLGREDCRGRQGGLTHLGNYPECDFHILRNDKAYVVGELGGRENGYFYLKFFNYLTVLYKQVCGFQVSWLFQGLGLVFR